LPRYTALLDACVLVPIALADTLLRVAERELYRPLWSERILAEAADAVLEIHPDLAPDVVAKRFAAMNDTFKDAPVEGWEIFEGTLTLPDPDDRHVVAAAMRGRADAIVTANIRDFPDETLAPLEIAVVHPDDFLLDQLDLAPRVVLDLLREQAAHTRNPPLTPTDLLTRLARAGVPAFADEAGRMI
jgi:predicted nucleic acid-binding protein